jgi:hypothetical protein
MESALSTISVLPSNKEQVQKFTRMLKDEILAGTSDPLKTLVQLKFIEKTISDILKDEDLDYHFLKEFNLFDNKEKVIVNGAELRASEVGTKYHYEESGDPVWIDLQKQSEALKEKIKEREKFLQAIPYDGGIVDAGTGLYISHVPKTSHTKVVVKL